MKKNSIKVSIESDFNAKIILDKLKKFNLKNFLIKPKVNNFENININLNHQTKKNEFVFFCCQIEKTFKNFTKSINEKHNQKELDKEINIFCQKIIQISKKNKYIYCFLWPLDVNDAYFGNLNYKYGYKSWLLNYINLKVSQILSAYENIFLLDLNYLLLKSKEKIDLFDEKTKYLFNSSYSYKLQLFIADKICETISNSILNKKIKLIILDCDNTLWGGEAGELEFNEVELGPNSSKGLVFQNFQRRLKLLKNFGFVLAICSKNFKSNVEKILKKNKNMILKFNDFSSIKANWKNKDENIKEILSELNLREENTLFIDDNPFERESVRNSLRNINILEFPKNLLNLNYEINNYLGLSKNYISNTDIKRSKFYYLERKRNDEKEKFQNLNNWIKSLKINISFKTIQNYQRAEELFNRTNQFNTTNIRYTINDLKKIAKKSSNKIIEIAVTDKFGDYGIISYVILDIKKDKFILTDFILSCRVFKRFVEETIIYFLRSLFKNKSGYIVLKKNKKNKYVQEFLKSCKFLKKHNENNYKIKEDIKFKIIDNEFIKVKNQTIN